MKAGVISMGLEGSSTSFLRAEERSKHCERTFLWALWWDCVGKGLPKPKPLNSFLLSSSVFVAHLSKSCCVKDVIRKTGGRGQLRTSWTQLGRGRWGVGGSESFLRLETRSDRGWERVALKNHLTVALEYRQILFNPRSSRFSVGETEVVLIPLCLWRCCRLWGFSLSQRLQHVQKLLFHLSRARLPLAYLHGSVNPRTHTRNSEEFFKQN